MPLPVNQTINPEPWQCAVNAPAPDSLSWCFLEKGHSGAHSWNRGYKPTVTYTMYAHSNKEAAYEAARNAGFTDEELEGRFADLNYVGYEITIKVTVNRETGEIKEEYS